MAQDTDSVLYTDSVLLSVLRGQVQVVAAARNKASSLKKQRDDLLEQWNKDNRELLDSLTQAGAGVAVEEATLRELTLQAYQETGNKQPVEGVGVKIFRKLLYNQDEAKDWCLEHRVALKLDTPVFEKLAQAEKLSFVTHIEEPRAQIASNLSGIVVGQEAK